jgi:two-component system response regulator PilR (NtrC family)
MGRSPAPDRGDDHCAFGAALLVEGLKDENCTPSKRPFFREKRYFADMTVLFVEDHADTRGVLGALLNRCGCQTVTAKNSADALAHLEEMRFDVLISDLTLPDGDGLDLVTKVKAKHPIKAIALTGRASPEERDAGLAAGFDFYLTKPVDFHELREAIKS